MNKNFIVKILEFYFTFIFLCVKLENLCSHLQFKVSSAEFLTPVEISLITVASQVT